MFSVVFAACRIAVWFVLCMCLGMIGFSFGCVVWYCWMVVWLLFGVGCQVVDFVFDFVGLFVVWWICYAGLLYCCL